MKLHFKAPFKKQKLEFRHRSVSRAASDTKGKGKDEKVRIVKKHDSVGDSLDEIHAMELEDAAKRHAERNAIRLGEIELAKSKQEFEMEKYKAKVRKMELEAKKAEQQHEIFKLMLSRSQPGSQASAETSYTAATASSSSSHYSNNWDTFSHSQSSTPLHFPQSPGPLTAELYDNWGDNIDPTQLDEPQHR